MNKYLYIRVSSKDQNEARQLEDAAALNIPKENIFIDKQSGKDFNRPEYLRLVGSIEKGDIIYFHSIDRMGRNYDEILDQWKYITKNIGADIVILDMPLLDTTMKNNDLTSRLIADIVLQLLSYVAQREREAIKIRQAEGIKIAKEKGKYERIHFNEGELENLKRLVDEKQITVTRAAEIAGVTRKTLYKRWEKLGVYVKDSEDTIYE